MLITEDEVFPGMCPVRTYYDHEGDSYGEQTCETTRCM